MHIKRSKMPTTWPVERKSTKERFIAKARHASKESITILALMRDVLKLANSRKEVKMILHKGEVLINGVVRKDEVFPVNALDNISLFSLNKHYRLEIVGKKYALTEISQKESAERVLKILGKKILGENKSQINLEGGVNDLYGDDFKVGDSALYSFKDKKILKIIPLKKGCKVLIIKGKHAGEKGELVDIKTLKKGKAYEIKIGERNVLLPNKAVLVVN